MEPLAKSTRHMIPKLWILKAATKAHFSRQMHLEIRKSCLNANKGLADADLLATQ
jgi:hypothetical protein